MRACHTLLKRTPGIIKAKGTSCNATCTDKAFCNGVNPTCTGLEGMACGVDEEKRCSAEGCCSDCFDYAKDQKSLYTTDSGMLTCDQILALTDQFDCSNEKVAEKCPLSCNKCQKGTFCSVFLLGSW